METNSLKAFQELKDSGLLGKRQLEVYRIILENPNLTDREIAEKLEEEDSNYVRPRRRDLVKLGLIEKVGDKMCSISHKTASIWKKKNYDLKLILEKKVIIKNSKYYLEIMMSIDKKLKQTQEKYLAELMKEKRQATLFNFNKKED